MKQFGLVCLLLIVTGCAGPIRDLWPPPPGTPSVTILVSLDTWHAMIAWPVEKRRAEDGALYEEWGYAERAWYLEGRQGSTGAIRAMFWPTDGVVEVGEHDQIWAERTPQPPAEVFTFQVSETGFRRLRGYLQSTIANEEPLNIGESRFYPARDSYHLFHNCNQYAAQALREAGLPVAVWAAVSRGALAEQLRDAERQAARKQSALIGIYLSGGTSIVIEAE